MEETKTLKVRKSVDLTNEEAEKIRLQAFDKRVTQKELLEQLLTKAIAKLK